MVEMFFARCSNVLITEDLLDSELARHLEFMAQMMQHPVMRRRRGEDEDLGMALLCAAQRQVCSGDESNVWGILRYTFAHLVDMFKHDEATRQVARTSLMFSNYVILLVARSVVSAALEADASCLDDLEAVIFIYSHVFEKLGETDRPIDSDYRKSVHRVWHRAFDDLQALSPAEAPMRPTIIEWWLHFGTKSGVDVDAPYDPSAEITEGSDGAEGWSKDMGCGWRECLCFGERTYHSLRMCKRCRKVMYCSIKCQRRDWMEGGHKYVCRPDVPAEVADEGGIAKALQQMSLAEQPAKADHNER
ncbi:zinc finger MYND domain-containing protein [Phanerochaete sordida]|uniref:Zinc finger MYND domain-containing protein n=1 Tax=Phanerochaete sordida TaxID=48140 RepID=A0A9P3LI31_9APHY|nr:zinc finger MYND domain-containing protein [Phanerochaete sordida]